MAQDSPLYSTIIKRPSHRRQSSAKSLSFLMLSSSPSSPPSSYRPSHSYGIPSSTPPTSPSLGLQVPPPMPHMMLRRASDGYASSGSAAGSTVGSETVTPSTSTSIPSHLAAPSAYTPATRVKRSCSTSALTALSLSSAASPRIRQISGKATIAKPALDCANSDIGDLSNRSRSESVSTLNDIILPHLSYSTSSTSSPSTSSSASLASPPLDKQPQAVSTVSVNEKRRPNLTSFMSNLMTSWNHSHSHAHNDEDAQEILSTSSLSSPLSPMSPTTPTSIPATSCLSSPTQRSVSYSAFWQTSYDDESPAQNKGSPRAKNVQLSSPPSKRSRSNTVNTCLKSSLALQNVTGKTGHINNDVTPRKRASNLSLRGLPAFTLGSVKGDGSQSSPKSPRSPLSQLSFSPQVQVADFEDETAAEVKRARSATASTSAGSTSFSSLLLPHMLSSDLSTSTTPLTPLHTIYIDHIAVAYNPASSSGQECKKLLMRLERFKKRSSVDLTSLSVEKASMILNAVNVNSHTASTNPATAVEGGGVQKSPHSTPTSARISRCNSAGSVNASPSPAPHLNKPTSGHVQSFKVTAKIRDHREPNKIEVVYVDGFRLTFDATGLTHLDMLERIGHHAHVMAKRNAT